jgi:methyl-accepting chemotaxis protein
MNRKLLVHLFLSNRKFLVHLFQSIAPLALMILVGGTHTDFIMTAVKGNAVLNSLIVLVGLIGTVLWIAQLLNANRERLTLVRFETEVQDGASMTALLEEPWTQGRSCRGYLESVASTGGKLSSSLDQSAIDAEIEHMRGEFDSRMELPAYLVGFMIALGLLGTFIGLLETLTGISGMLDGMVNTPTGESIDSEFLKLVGQLRKPLSGMGIAFSASMFGLLGSLLLGSIQMTVRRFTKTVINDAHEMVNRLTERVRGHSGTGVAAGAAPTHGGVSQEFMSDIIGDLVNNIGQLMEMFHRSQDSSLAVSSRIDNLTRRLEDVIGAIDSNVEAVRRTNDLLGFGPRMKETNEETLTEIRALLSSSQDRQKIMTRLADAMTSIDQKLSAGNDGARSHFDLVGNINVQTLAKLDEAVGVLHDVNDRTSDSESKLDRKMQALATTTTSISTALQQLTSKMGEMTATGQTQITNASAAQQMLRDASNDVQGLLGGLQEKMQKIQEVEIGANRHLYGIKESVDTMGTLLEPLKTLSQGVSRQTSVLEATLEEMRTSQRNLVRDLRTELREASRQVSPG